MRDIRSLRLYKFIIVALSVSTAVWVWNYLSSMNILPIRIVKVEGNYPHIMPDELKAIIYPYTQKNFFSFDMAALKNKLIQIPWVTEVSIHRIWPDTVKIQVNEQNAVARWGESEILNRNGEIFQPEQQSILDNLPTLKGPSVRSKQILKDYLKMSDLLGSIGLQLSSLDMSKHYKYELQLTSGTVLFLDEAHYLIELQRFVNSYDDLIVNQDTPPIQVDLRYPDGMAVEWTRWQG